MKSIVKIPVERVESLILLIRGEKVILDRELAKLYGVSTRALNQAVKRNLDRFPEDFMFQLTTDEAKTWWEQSVGFGLRSQNVILKKRPGQHLKYRPYVFTEHGILMLSSVLKSDRAVQVNIEIMRTFVRLRQMLTSNAELTRRLEAMERNYDDQLRVVFEAIRELMSPPAPSRKQIGFRPKALKQ